MKKMNLIPLLVATFLALPVFAQSMPVAEQREINQQQRIENGVASGQLNAREAARLDRQQSRIDQAQTRAVQDGKVTAAERAHVDNMQDRTSRHIYRQKHDAQTAAGARGENRPARHAGNGRRHPR